MPGVRDQEATRTLLIDGDISIDWQVMIPSESAARVAADRALGQGFGAHLSSEAGGVARFAAHLKAAAEELGGSFSVISPGVDIAAVRSPDLTSVARTFSVWEQRPRAKAKTANSAWRMTAFLGDERASVPPAAAFADETPPFHTLLLNDQFFGYREQSEAWAPILAKCDGDTRIVLRAATPLASGALWNELITRFADQLTVIVAASDLRRDGANLGVPLSWERTWATAYAAVRGSAVSAAAKVVVTIGGAGAILVSRDGQTTIVFDPPRQENDWESEHVGLLATSPLFVASAVALGETVDGVDQAEWIRRGLVAARISHVNGPEFVATSFGKGLVAPSQAVGRALAGLAAEDDGFAVLELPDAPSADLRIAQQVIPESDARDAANTVAIHGLQRLHSAIPIESVGAWVSIDRYEIEAVRSLRSLVQNYILSVEQQHTSRPLSIAVFGPPGSGKSFAVKQLAMSLLAGRCTTLEFNLSQLRDYADLPAAFNEIRDAVLRGLFPLVIWDEFDSSLGDMPLGWLRAFLAPMQDGLFFDGTAYRPTGHAIFVFSGGTAETFEQFNAGEYSPAERAAKKPDFVSRLRGFLNIVGPNPGETQQSSYATRRALLLRSLLRRRAPQLFRGEELKIAPGVLRAFLHVDRYYHGARSMEALLDMSSVAGLLSFEPSGLPPASQLALHVDAANFLELVAGE